MSDELRRFAARMVDTGSIGVIRPRVASRFESPSAADGGEPAARAGLTDGWGEVDLARPALAPTEASAATHPGTARTASIADSWSVAAESGSAATPSSAAVDRVATPESFSPLDVSMSRLARSQSSPEMQTHSATLQNETPISIQSRDRHDIIGVDPIAQLAESEPPISVASMPERQADSPLVRPRHEPPTRPAFDAVIEPALPSRRAEPAPASPTIVQVTIGSVEVRQPASPPRRPPIPRAAPGPRLSLREYLQRRNEGRR